MRKLTKTKLISGKNQPKTSQRDGVKDGQRDGVKDGQRDGVKDGQRLTENQRKILDEIKKDKYLTAENLSIKVGINKRNIEKNLSILQDKNIIKRMGPSKGGYWKILK